MATVISMAKQLDRALVTGKRDNGEDFYKLRDEAPQWMIDAVHAAHGDMLPDDWKYKMIADLASSLAELDDDATQDAIERAIYELEAPVYTAQLVDWLGSGGRISYADEVLEDGGAKTITDLMQAGYQRELAEVANLLCDALAEAAADEASSDE